MIRTMVFIDYCNFDIALKELHKSKGEAFPRLEYYKLSAKLTATIPDARLLKVFLCYPEPDEFLKQDTHWFNYSRALSGNQNAPFIDVIKGRYVSRLAPGAREKCITDPNSFYKEEKGTDINIATHLLTKAFNNSYDMAILISADTDYCPTLEVLRTIGKISMVAMVEGQVSPNLEKTADIKYTMKYDFFKDCLRTS